MSSARALDGGLVDRSLGTAVTGQGPCRVIQGLRSQAAEICGEMQ